jgi:LacI family transcriptional regulator
MGAVDVRVKGRDPTCDTGVDEGRGMGTSRRRGSRVTLADVARRAGVSSTTVSFVLTGRDMGISTPTADRVLEAARDLGYDHAARQRRSRDAQMPVIGFVTDTVASDHYSGEMIRGAIQAAGELDHGIITTDTEGRRKLEEDLVQGLIDRGVDRFVYAAAATRVTRLPEALVDQVTVLVNCRDPRSIATAILPDEARAGTTAVRTLLDAGHTDRIWLVGATGRVLPFAGRERKKAIVATLAAAGQSLARQVHCPWSPPGSLEAVGAALQNASADERPTAVIALNDRIAMGVYQAAAALRIGIPRDLSVVSFDNSELSWWLSPGLTSIGLPYFEMGRRAVEAVLAATTSDAVELVAMPMYARQSIAPPRRRRSRRRTANAMGGVLDR